MGGGRSFVPALGDWSGSENGYPVSFQLLYKPRLGHHYDSSPYFFTDVAVLEPEVDTHAPGCPMVGASAGFFDEGIDEPLRAGGTLTLTNGADVRLRITGPHTAVVSLADVYPKSSGVPAACNRRLSGAVRADKRRKVTDGTWSLQGSSAGAGAGSTFTVRAGGRVASGVEFPTLPSTCGNSSIGSLVLYIEPDGKATLSKAGAYSIALDFTGPGSASGQMSFGTGAECALGVNATLTKRRG